MLARSFLENTLDTNDEIELLLGRDTDSYAIAPEDLFRERVIEKAALLFLRDGISNVRMTDIADASGVGVATLYRRFSTKTHIVVAAGELLWKHFNRRILDLVESDDFLELNGADRLEVMLVEYATHYAVNHSFVSFLDDFDHMVIAERVAPEELMGYDRALNSFYIIFEDAYQMGLADKSIKRTVDFKCFYSAVAHALVGVAEKLSRGEVIPSDDFSHGWLELDCIVDMATRALRQE